MESEIARFREQQELAEQAAERGLSGYAITSRHAFIEQRMEQGAIYLQKLMEAGRYDEAFSLMETEQWQGIPVFVLVERSEEGKCDERDVTNHSA